jgi:hypothetical protein
MAHGGFLIPTSGLESPIEERVEAHLAPFVTKVHKNLFSFFLSVKRKVERIFSESVPSTLAKNESGRICNSKQGGCCCYENLSRKLETKREAEVPRESQTPVLWILLCFQNRLPYTP